jgi:hypothetical protein
MPFEPAPQITPRLELQGSYALRPSLFAVSRLLDSERMHSAIIASLLVATVALVLPGMADEYRHLFIIPISACGVLIGTDAIDWFRGRLDIFDPVGLIGILGLHFFFLAPLLHVAWQYWIPDVAPPPDWRDWLGYMGMLNAVGLAVYQIARKWPSLRKAPTSFWRIDERQFQRVVPVCIAVAVCIQVWVYAQYGGITGYIEARMRNPRVFGGMGWIFMISESAPILAVFLVIVLFRQKRRVSWATIGCAFALLFVFQMLFGGLRGSRSETIQLLFWVAACVHVIIRPVPRKVIYVGCAFLALFMYLYGFYKNLGTEATQVFSESADARNEVAEATGRTWRMIVLDDLGRADLQAFILYRLRNDKSEFTYAKGRTYLGAVALLLPHWLVAEHPETVEEEGTEIQIGTGGYFKNISWSSRVYGLAGEGMLNFGPLAVPLTYGLFGLLVGWFRNFSQGLPRQDGRQLLIPFIVYMLVSVLGADSDNLVYGLVKSGLMPALVVMACCTKIARSLRAKTPTAEVRITSTRDGVEARRRLPTQSRV